MNIDWPKVSGLALEALFQAIISLAVIYITYYLGKKSSDRDWKREISYKEREQTKQAERELLKRRIELLREMLNSCSILETYPDKDKRMDALSSVVKASTLFENNYENDMNDRFRRILMAIEEMGNEPGPARSTIIDSESISFFKEKIEHLESEL